MIEDRLRPPNREGGDHDRAAALYGAADNGAEHFGGISGVMLPIAVGGLDDHMVSFHAFVRIGHQRVAIASKIARKNDVASPPTDLGDRRTEYMAGTPEFEDCTFSDFRFDIKIDRGEELHRPLRVLHAVKGEGRLVLCESLPIGEVGILLIKKTAIFQDQFGHVARGVRGIDAAPKSVPNKLWQIPGVIEMGMRQNDRINARRLDRQRLPVEFTQIFQTLKQTAIHEDMLVATSEQMLRTSDGPRAAK